MTTAEAALPRYIVRPSRRFRGRVYLVDTRRPEKWVLAWSRHPGRVRRCARVLNLWAARKEATA